MPSDDGAPFECVDRVNAWMLTELTRLNRDILARRRPPVDLSAELTRSVLPNLMPPECLPTRQAKQMVVLLGLAGASLSRHYQEFDDDHRVAPERAFDSCPVGEAAVPFLVYFRRLAERTGTGHCHRDSYAALTRWNVPTTEVFPALLDRERELLTGLMQRPSLPDTVLRSLGFDAFTLAGMSAEQLRKVVGRYPVLAALYLLLIAHARMSGTHLKIARKYLFVPQRRREAAGLGDPGVVSNRLGTTGMDEHYLEKLTRARQRHVLTCLRILGGSDLACLAGLDHMRAMPTDLGRLVRFTGPRTGQDRPVEWLDCPGKHPGRGGRIGAGTTAASPVTHHEGRR